jgi:hypothetical protein
MEQRAEGASPSNEFPDWLRGTHSSHETRLPDEKAGGKSIGEPAVPDEYLSMKDYTPIRL